MAVVAGVLLLGVNVAIWGGRAQVNGPAATQRPVEIQSLQPAEDELMLPQGPIIVDLRDQFTGQITVDNEAIPQDQTTEEPGLGIITFDPGPGKDIREFAKGGHNATIQWWPREIASPEEALRKHQLRSYSWAFKVG